MALTEFDGELDNELPGYVEFNGSLDDAEQGGFIPSAKRAIGAGIKGAGQAAADFIPGVDQDNALKQYGQEVIEANPTAVNSLGDIADKPGKAVAEATGNAASSMAGIVGARALGQGITALSPLAGPAAPIVAAAGQVVSWLGPAAVAALPSFGGIRDKQILNDPQNVEDGKAKAIAALGAATVGAIESRFGPQNWALAAMTKEGRAKLAEKFAATTLKGSIAKGAVKGAAIEGAEELVQNPIEQLAAFDNPTTPENLKETAFGGAMGAIGGGVLGGGTGAVFRNPAEAAQQEDESPIQQEPIPTINGKPVTEHSDAVLNYTANRGGERAKAAAKEELDRRAMQGVDPEIANAHESASEAVDRIIATGKDKADEIRETRQTASDAIQDDVFDEPDHIGGGNKMVDAPIVQDSLTVADAPTPEPIETLNAQMDALADGRKSAVLITPGEPMPHALPEGVLVAEIPGRGTLLYRDEKALQDALNGKMGDALDYGINEKPPTDQVVTARDESGAVIQDVATDGSQPVLDAAQKVAGANGSVEVRPVEEAMAERNANTAPASKVIAAADGAATSPTNNLINPTEAQKEAGNFKVGRARVNGLDISIEYPAGVARKEGHKPLSYPYGYIRGTVGRDKDHVDVFLGPNVDDDSNPVFVVDQMTKDGKFDEHKVLMGFGSEADARAGYLANYPDGWTGLGAIREMAADEFKSWVKDASNTRLPVARETRPAPMPSVEDKSREAQSPAENDSVSNEAQAVHPVRPLLESLIKRRAAAKQGGKDLSSAIARAKEVMEGKRTDTAVEHKYFRLQAKAFEKADPEAANVLRQIAEAVKTKELSSDSPKFSRAPQPADFVEAPDGGVDFGQITKDVGTKIKRQAAPIRLVNGVHNSDGSGHGLVHIEANHGKQIRNAGFESVESFVAHVAKNFNEILHASGRQLLVAVENGRKDVMFVQLEPSENGDYYRINTAFPTSRDYLEKQIQKGMKVLWSGSEPALAVTGKQPAYAADPEASSSQDDPIARGQSDSNITDEGVKFNRERISETRKRLKSASGKAKQATSPGGLSVSEVERIVAHLKESGLKIHVAATEKDLPQTVKERIKSTNARGVRGVYLPATDEIWLVSSRLDDSFEVVMVTLHEARHRGLRKTYGPGLNPILRQIYATNKRVRDSADVLMRSFKGMGKDEATEEVLADMPIDRVRGLNGWKKLVRFIKQWIAEKFDLTFTDAVVEQLVAGAELVGLESGEVSFFDDADAESYAGTAEGNGAPRFSRSGSQGGVKQKGSNASWGAPEPSKLDNLIYSLQNKHIDMKRVMESIRDTGAQLAEKFDAYLQEELFHGRAAKRTKDFVNNELKPLIAGLKLRGLSVDELDKYLHARHAQEANALIAQRDPTMPDGGSGMTNKEAKDYLANLPADKKRRLEQVAKKVDDIIAQTRDLYVSYGLISQAEADSWAQMFKHYVPLMREDKDGGMGIGQGFSIKGKEAKHRTGSTRAVVDILANIALQRERAVVRGEKNRVAVSLAGLAKLNPNPDFWTFDKVPTERVIEPEHTVYKVIYSGSEVIEFTSRGAAQRFVDYEGKGYAIKEERVGERVVNRPVPNFKNRDNVIVAKIKDSKGNVIERAVIFNEDNDRAMRMAQAIKNLDASQLEGLMGVSAKVTRYFAAINTQYNPVFGVVNLTRDLQASLINLSSTPIAGHKAAVLGNIIPAIRAIYASSRGERKGNQSTSAMAALWDEMQKEGGMTGYRDLFKTSEDRANAIKRELDPTAWMNSGLGKIFTAGGALKVPLAIAQKRAGWLFDWLSDYNQTLEGAMRLSVYKVAIDKGLSKQEAASIAKNISVNFNRKGQSGQQAGALYAFFNAAMQGTARIGETMTTMDKGDIRTFRFNKAGKQIIVGGITLGAMQALALAAAGFDDDEPPEFVRERSLIIPIGDKKYVTVPMPLGFHAIPNIGRISTEFAMGGFKKPAEHTAKLMAVFAEAFNPIGSAGLSIQTIAPTAIDPLVALSENRDWTGKPIAKEDFNQLSPTPGFSRNKNTASDPAKWLAEVINTLSGGNKYVPGVMSPTADQIDYLAGQVTGGVGRETGKLNQSVGAILTGEDLPPHKIPLIGRFYGDSEGQASQGNAFYSNLKRINELEAELKGRRKDKLPIDEFKAENPEYRLVQRANLVERLVSKQRKLKNELIEKGAPREQVKIIDERITNLMAGLNRRAKDLKEARQ